MTLCVFIKSSWMRETLALMRWKNMKWIMINYAQYTVSSMCDTVWIPMWLSSLPLFLNVDMFAEGFSHPGLQHSMKVVSFKWTKEDVCVCVCVCVCAVCINTPTNWRADENRLLAHRFPFIVYACPCPLLCLNH